LKKRHTPFGGSLARRDIALVFQTLSRNSSLGRVRGKEDGRIFCRIILEEKPVSNNTKIKRRI